MITIEQIRNVGGIVHSDGNIFFKDISMLHALHPNPGARSYDEDTISWALTEAHVSEAVEDHIFQLLRTTPGQ